MYPGFVPEVRLVQSPEQPGSGVAIIRIYESPQAPHAIQNSTRVYIRTGQHSLPEDLADLPRLERLLRRRSEREARRDREIGATRERAMTLFPTWTWSALAVSPLYPDADLRVPKAILKWARERFTQRTFYPRAGGASSAAFRPKAANEPKARLGRYIELGAKGLAYFASSWETEAAAQDSQSLNLLQVVHALARDLEDSALFLEWLGFQGHVQIQYALEGAGGLRLVWPHYPDSVPGLLPSDYDHRASATRTADSLTSNELVLELINELRWSMGYGEFTRLDWFSSVIQSARQEQR